MDENTSTALRRSIEIWTRRSNGELFDALRKSCPLCVEHWAFDCVGCPIAEQGYYRCSDTPCEEYSDFYEEASGLELERRSITLSDGSCWPVEERPVRDDDDIGRLGQCAAAEVEFLQSLFEK